MKVSEISTDEVKRALRLDPSDPFIDRELAPRMKAAVEYMKAYTGLTAEQLDEHEDMYHAFMVLVQDMYDNRAMYVERSSVNKTVEIILDMHSVNLL